MVKPRQDSIHDARNLPIFVVDDALIDRHGAELGAYGVAVYVTLARFAKDSHATILAYQTIADALGIARSTVQTTIKRLAEVGVIRIEPQTDDAGNPVASNRYVLLPIGDKKAEQTRKGGTATRYPVPPHGTPLPPENRGYRQTDGGVPPDVYMYHDPSHDQSDLDPPPPPLPPTVPIGGGGGDEFFRELRKRGISRAKATEIAAMDVDPETVLTSIDNLHDPNEPYSLSRIVNQLIDAPPLPGKPYGDKPPANGHRPATSPIARLDDGVPITTLNAVAQEYREQQRRQR